LAGHLPGHDVETVPRLGWSGVKNGALLRRASASFEVFVTGDQSLEFQQNLTSISIGIVVVVAKNNRVETFLALASQIVQAIESVKAGGVVRVAG
jgi:hypothetical protein